MLHIHAGLSAVTVAGGLLVGGPFPIALAGEVEMTELGDRVKVEVNGQLVTEYQFKNVPRPFCYPLIGPDGLQMTRSWPMRDVPGEERDHPHHRSFWFSHGAVNGEDFWTERQSAGKIVHAGFVRIESGTNAGMIVASNHWVSAAGKLVCTDERTLRISSGFDDGISFDFDITLFAPADEELVFGDTKEGTMAVRVAESMRLTKPTPRGQQLIPSDGHIVNSEGQRDEETWGQRAAWCDYYGPVNGKTVGVAIFDHPNNPRHPTWWHVRNYGLFAANPFGRHDFEELSDVHAGDLAVKPGDSVTFRYRVLLHRGDEKQAEVARRYDEYVRSNP